MTALIVCVNNPELQSRLRAAALLMAANLRELTLERFLNAKPDPSAWVLVDHDLDELLGLARHFQFHGLEPAKHIIRFIEKPWQSYVYHDAPIFASIVMPPDPLATAQVLQRLAQAKPLTLLSESIVETAQEAVGPLDPAFVRSPPMQLAVLQLQKLKLLPIDTVLLGPTGAGKDTMAQWLHQQSGVKGRFVHINCAALPEQLFEAELFGVVAGAYTGANKDRPGKLELADQGTLYLDEIDSLSLGCQAKLLNALQYRGATRLGGQRFYQVEFRVIASTKVHFPELVSKGLFREDLYFRLNVSQVRIPALAERLEDILPLYMHFLSQAASKFGLPVPSMQTDEVDALLSHPWPGNVRELYACAQRHVVGLGTPFALSQEPNAAPDLKQRLWAIEKTLIEHGLKEHRGCVKSAAQALGIPLHSMYYRLKRFDLACAEPDAEKI